MRVVGSAVRERGRGRIIWAYLGEEVYADGGLVHVVKGIVHEAGD